MYRLPGAPQASTTSEPAIYVRHYDAKLFTTRMLAHRQQKIGTVSERRKMSSRSSGRGGEARIRSCMFLKSAVQTVHLT